MLRVVALSLRRAGSFFPSPLLPAIGLSVVVMKKSALLTQRVGGCGVSIVVDEVRMVYCSRDCGTFAGA